MVGLLDRPKRTLREINSDFERVLKDSTLSRIERFCAICELIDEVVVFYELYEPGLRDQKANELYQKMLKSRFEE